MIDFLTALLEYLDLLGARLCRLFSKSEGTSTLKYQSITLIVYTTNTFSSTAE